MAAKTAIKTETACSIVVIISVYFQLTFYKPETKNIIMQESYRCCWLCSNISFLSYEFIQAIASLSESKHLTSPEMNQLPTFARISCHFLFP